MNRKTVKSSSDPADTPTDNAGTPREARRPLPEWLAVRLDVPPDLLAGGFRVELRGRSSATVHGCLRIGTYTPERITLTVRGGAVTVCGQRLECTSYLAGAVGIDGQIEGILLKNDDGEGRTDV